MRSYHVFTIVMILFVCTNTLFSQTIIKRHKQFVLINTYNNGIKIGDELFVIRKIADNEMIKIGKVRIVKYDKGWFAGKILTKHPKFEIRKGDSVLIPEMMAKGNRSHISYFAMGAGIISAGIGIYFHSQANQRYDDYKVATIPQSATSLYNKTRTYDKRANIGYAIGGGLVGLGILYTIFKKGEEPQKYTPFTLKQTLDTHQYQIQLVYRF